MTDSSASHSAALIFVIEDDLSIAQLLQRLLESFNFRVQVFHNGRSALVALPKARPSLCLVDLGLPDIDGIELVTQISRTCNCGVLILTSRDHPVDKVMSLELGADDYVTKPFDERELVARIRSIIRRKQNHNEPIASVQPAPKAQFMGWTYDCTSHNLQDPCGGEHYLGTAEAQVLKVFLEHPHHILNREQLLGQDDLSPLDRSIDVRISRLRRKLEADPKNPKVIKTVYGSGYMFTAQVEWI